MRLVPAGAIDEADAPRHANRQGGEAERQQQRHAARGGQQEDQRRTVHSVFSPLV